MHAVSNLVWVTMQIFNSKPKPKWILMPDSLFRKMYGDLPVLAIHTLISFIRNSDGYYRIFVPSQMDANPIGYCSVYNLGNTHQSWI